MTWNHQCPEDGSIEVGRGEECSWCGRTEEQEPARIPFVPQDLAAAYND